MKLTKIFMFFVAMFVMMNMCLADVTNNIPTIMITHTLFGFFIIFCVLVYFILNILIIKAFDLFGLCIVIVLNIYAIPAFFLLK